MRRLCQLGYPGLRASGRARTGSARLRVACTTRRAALALGGAGGRSRTGRLLITSRALPRGSLAGVRALGGSRTRTDRLLGTAPLPVGLRGHGRQSRTGNLHLRARYPAFSLVHQLPHGAVRLELPAALREEDSNLQPSAPEAGVLPVAPSRNGAGRRGGRLVMRERPTPRWACGARTAGPCPPWRAYGRPCAGCRRSTRRSC